MNIPAMCNLNQAPSQMTRLTEADLDAAVVNRLAWLARIAPVEAGDEMMSGHAMADDWPPRRVGLSWVELPESECFDPPGFAWICAAAFVLALLTSVLWPMGVAP